MVGTKTFYAFIVIGFIVLHILASYIPYGWDAIMKLAGLPALSLPPPY